MQYFLPKRVFFEEKALEYPLGQDIYRRFREEGVEVKMIGSHNRVTGIPGKTSREGYFEAKRTLVVGVRKTLKFETCKPSAHYQLPMVTSCPGMCEYCYLATTLGKKPYIRVYVNIEEILAQAGKYIEERKPEITIFEGAATSDPIPVELYTNGLRKAIEFFGGQESGRFRFVTKFTGVDSLLDAKHNGHTRFRFSLNGSWVIRNFERSTPGLEERMAAAVKVAEAGYPLGFIIAPIMIYPGWEQDYTGLLSKLRESLGDAVNSQDLTFELITHRFTTKAKTHILDIFPGSRLPMEEEQRRYKYGQFGYGKYVYPQETIGEIKSFMEKNIAKEFLGAKIEYLV